jgi:hypothetical protein
LIGTADGAMNKLVREQHARHAALQMVGEKIANRPISIRIFE